MEKVIVVEDLSELEALYNFRKKEEVAAFINTQPSLVPLLLEAHPEIVGEFPSADLFLEVYTDRETREGDHLVIFISTELKAREALKALDKIDEEWWINNIDRANGMLSINLEYR